MVTFKKLPYRLVYNEIKRTEGERLSIEEISDATGLGHNSVSAALKFLRDKGYIEQESPQKYYVVPLSLID